MLLCVQTRRPRCVLRGVKLALNTTSWNAKHAVVKQQRVLDALPEGVEKGRLAGERGLDSHARRGDHEADTHILHRRAGPVDAEREILQPDQQPLPSIKPQELQARRS